MTPKPQMPYDIFAPTTPRETLQPAPAEPEPERAETSAPSTRRARKPAVAAGAWKATQVRFDPETVQTLARLTELARRKDRPAVSNSALLRYALAYLVANKGDKDIVSECPVPTRVTVIQ